MSLRRKIIKWVLGDKNTAQNQLMRSVQQESAAGARTRQGDKFGSAWGAPAGRVAWPVEPESHDGASFIGCDAFFAHYDAKKKEVYCLDDIGGTRHRGANPLRVGKNVEIVNGEERSGRGFVIRAAEYGTEGLNKNVFFHADGDLVAHHRQPDPPTNSSLVHDPGEGPDDWAGGLHYALRVRRFIEQFCQGRTSTDDPVYAVLLNFTANGDGTVAHGAVHFSDAEACLSHEATGPLDGATDGNHDLGRAIGGSKVVQGALNFVKMLWGAKDWIYSPIEFIRAQWEPGAKGPFVMRVELREDFNDRHLNHCGKLVPGRKKWQTWAPFFEYEPPPWIPIEPPPPTDDPPIEPHDPSMILPPGRWPVDGPDPTVASPAEIEAPSEYGHPKPGLPEPGDIPHDAVPDHAKSGDRKTASSWGDAAQGEREMYWLSRYGYTEKEWNEQPFTSHTIHAPEYESNTVNDGADRPNTRWPTVKTTEPEIVQDEYGKIVGRTPGTGPGSIVHTAPEVKGHHIFAASGSELPSSVSDTTIIIHAAKDDSGNIVDTRFGLGARVPNTNRVARGWEFKLKYDGAGATAAPDLHLTSKDGDGAEAAASGAKFYVNGSEVGAGGATDHGALTGLSDDDHTQYHNDTRGDARYTQKSNNLSDLASDDTAIANLISGGSTVAPDLLTTRVAVRDSIGGGGAATVDELADAFVLRAIKTADQTYTSDTTLNNDTHLSVSLIAGGEYQIELAMFVVSGGTPDFKFDFDGGTATMSWFQCDYVLIPHSTSTTVVSGKTTAIATDIAPLTSNWPGTIMCRIGLSVSSGGTFILRHSQNTSSGTTTGLSRGSWMKATRVS